LRQRGASLRQHVRTTGAKYRVRQHRKTLGERATALAVEGNSLGYWLRNERRKSRAPPSANRWLGFLL